MTQEAWRPGEALEALDALFRDNEVPMSDRNGVLHDRLRQFIESAGADSERYRLLRNRRPKQPHKQRGQDLEVYQFEGRANGRSSEANAIFGAELDAAIDAALAARSPQPGEKT